MDVFDQSFEQLEQLASLYEEGKISEDQFRELKRRILEGEKVELIEKDTAAPTPPAALQLDLLTSCRAANRKARLANLLKHKDALSKSIHAQKFFDQIRRPLPSTRPKQLRANLSLKQESVGGKKIPQLSPGRLRSLARAGLGESLVKTVIVIVIIASSVFISQTPTAKITALKLKSLTATAAAVTRSNLDHPSPPDLQPLFGPIAVSACTDKCAPSNQERCQKKCENLSLERYVSTAGRKSSPSRDAKSVFNNCISKKVGPASGKANTEEADRQLQAAESLLRTRGVVLQESDISKKEEFYESLLQTYTRLRALRPGEKSTREANETLRAVCLGANAALTDLAFARALAANDSESFSYYNKLVRLINIDLLEYERTIAQD